MKIRAKLGRAIVSGGFTLKQGVHEGDLDDRGIVWLEPASTHRLGSPATTRKIGVHAGRFEYVEEPTPATPGIDKRASINAAVKAAEAKRNGTAKA